VPAYNGQMYIKRDITQLLQASPALIQVLLGPRQCGKSTLFAALYPVSEHTPKAYNEVTFDDLQMRQLANTDPALFLQQFEPPLLLDEVQYVPNLFPELKKTIDQIKLKNVFQPSNMKLSNVMYRLTGSNQILMDKNVKESLAGRASYFHLNTLSVHEIIHALPSTTLKEILFKGGWPELYTNHLLSVTQYLNDYIRSYIEKDIAQSSGIQKLAEFLTVLRLCAARTGQEIDYSDIQKDSGASAVTVKEWIGILERADIVYLLPPYFNNLNKRLIKRPKIYFLDTGLAARLQGWSEPTPLMNSPQIGGLFETLALGEMVKFIRNYGKDWQVFFARTKDGQEVDFIIKTAAGAYHLFEVKFAIHGISRPVACPPAFKTEFGKEAKLVVITSGGERLKLSRDCMVLPIMHLHDYLHEIEWV
jgi:predicted AAA+ superfamily ATPase